MSLTWGGYRYMEERGWGALAECLSLGVQDQIQTEKEEVSILSNGLFR